MIAPINTLGAITMKKFLIIFVCCFASGCSFLSPTPPVVQKPPIKTTTRTASKPIPPKSPTVEPFSVEPFSVEPSKPVECQEEKKPDETLTTKVAASIGGIVVPLVAYKTIENSRLQNEDKKCK